MVCCYGLQYEGLFLFPVASEVVVAAKNTLGLARILHHFLLDSDLFNIIHVWHLKVDLLQSTWGYSLKPIRKLLIASNAADLLFNVISYRKPIKPVLRTCTSCLLISRWSFMHCFVLWRKNSVRCGSWLLERLPFPHIGRHSSHAHLCVWANSRLV